MIQTIEYMWFALGLYWLASAQRIKRAKQTEGQAAHWLRIGLLVVLFDFLFSSWGRVGWLGERFVPASRAIAIAGVATVLVGLALAAWARSCLRGNWSSAVTIKEGHELIRMGPYKCIRHPIYTGMALGLAGTALAIGEWRGILAFAAVLTAHVIKARKEEQWLAREFGSAFDEHRSHTGMFLPRLS